MTDIVERLRSMARYEHDDLSIGNDAADEIESLRQRVKELEESLSIAINTGMDQIDALNADYAKVVDNMNANAEYAISLKQSQGEPVCYLREEWLSYEQSAEGQPGAFPVYTSAPTIPEGWQLVPNNITDEWANNFLRLHGSRYRWSNDGLKYFFTDILSAAPAGPRPADHKPEDVK